ncbi:zona pellucida sperm-binding protein 2 [Callorhinchus milii]|uniref:zona pellucida sperm-binding protein 2 n=1 Tax=Callorhinchus milii TaxID=7868 RepID=UPI001C3FB456|nr:zona pellucida sperm-binding protein 2 [Callorhinchus milii]
MSCRCCSPGPGGQKRERGGCSAHALPPRCRVDGRVTRWFLKSNCHDGLFWIGLNKTHLSGKLWQISVLDESGADFPVTPNFASQCGYTISMDPLDYVEFRASILACQIHIMAETFTLKIQIKLSANGGIVSTYTETFSCTYTAWAVRQIICEENYMQVSVPHGVPPIDQDYHQDAEGWISIFPEVITAADSTWQIVFQLPEEKRNMTVGEAHKMGYGINTTLHRILLRAPYHANESQMVLVQGIPLSVIRSTAFYKKPWLALLVDTTVACPLGNDTITEDTIVWTVPKIFTPLVQRAVIDDQKIFMGVNGKKLNEKIIDQTNYVLDINENIVAVTIPIGAEGGYYKSDVVNGQYGIRYIINLLLEFQWRDVDAWEENKLIMIHPITTPILRPPFLTDDTIPKQRLFNVTLGNFLLDVELIKVTLGPVSFTVKEVNQEGYLLYETTNPNGTKAFVLEVPIESSPVERKYIGDGVQQYILDIIYTLSVVPRNLIFTYPAHLIVNQSDVVLPIANGFCHEESMTLIVKRGSLDHYWIPFIGNVQLTQHKAEQSGYVLQDNGTHFSVDVPFYGPEVVYEVIYNQGVRSRLDITLKDNKTLTVLSSFSVSCSFPTTDLIGCFPNGTVIITLLKLELPLGMELTKMMLRDKDCKPKENAAGKTVYQFYVNSCGTSRRFEKGYMIYENEVAYFKESQPASDPMYRIAISCRYHINGTLHFQFEHKANPQPIVEPGYGPITLAMELDKDALYSEVYEIVEYPVMKYLTEPLYFEVQLLHNEDPQVELFLQDCWATSSRDQSGFPQWPIIVDSCENKADTHMTIFHQATNSTRVKYLSHVKRFEVKTFVFTSVDQQPLVGEVYFHCSAVICNSKETNVDEVCPGKCVPHKQRMGRSAGTHHYFEGSVSSGPILILGQVPGVEKQIEKDAQFQSYWPLLLTGGSVLLFAFVILGVNTIKC